MKTVIFKRRTRFLAAAAALLTISSCSIEQVIPDPGTKDDATVTFSFQVPGANTPSSRALSAADENAIREIDILVFEPNGGNFVYRAGCSGQDISTDPGDSRIKTFTVKLRRGDFDLVMLANSRGMLSNDLLTGLSKADALATLETAMPAGGKWITDVSSGSYRPFPMWGDIGNTTVNDQTDLTGSNRVRLTRMVARVDVQITAANFRITAVDVYNYNTTGTLVPRSADWDRTTDPAAPKVTAPRVPSTSTLTRGPISYVNTEINTTANECSMEIYLFESENHTDAEPKHTAGKGLLDRTCLVVGGVYDANNNGNFTDDGQPTWYRVDFSTGSGVAQNFLDVLRNHMYIFNIKKISGHGYKDSETAFISGPVNIEGEVLKWNESDPVGIIVGPQYYLAVSPPEAAYEDTAQTGKTVTIKTDCDSQMTLANFKLSDSPTDPNAGLTGGWIKNLSISGKTVAEGKNVYTLTYDVAENNSNARTGYIYVTLGRLTNSVRIAQAEGGGTIRITEHTFLPPAIQSPASQTLAILCRKNNGKENANMAWTLTVPSGYGWLKISNSPTVQGDGKTVQGYGSQTIYLFAESNATGSGPRSANLLLHSNMAPLTATVTQGNTPPTNESIETRNSCVGAFWKHDQTGERIVQINMGDNLGAWTATVTFYDARWNPANGDGVLLAMDGSSDGNVGKEGVTPGNAEDYKLTGYGYGHSISGYVAQAKQNIVFRIGLEKNFAAYSNMPDYTTTFPARYAVIELWYAGGSKMQSIYLRQGEGDDYVMPVVTPNRQYAKRFSPYNLTAADINAAAVGIRGGAPNPGYFVDYPSKIGAIFQWGTTHNLRYAYLPYVAGVDAWINNTNYVNSYWDPDLETCPTVGALVYRRPIDDRIAASSNGSRPERSEIRSSLWVDAPSGDDVDNSSSLYGYYADGYYDRHYVDKSGTYSIGVVGAGTVDVATIGRLFYNPSTKASLFLPTPGYRAGENGGYLSVGYVGHYFTSTSHSADLTRAWALSMRDPASDSYTRMLAISKTTGGSIRCVRND